MASLNTLNVTLVRSTIGRIEAHKATVKGLGLRRMHHTVTVQDTPAIRGMINTVSYLLNVVPGQTKEAVAKPSKASKPTVAAGSVPKKYLTKLGADDLTVVEGIGPKICEILNAAGIVSFKDLASAKLDKLQALLKAAGSRYALANPGTWSEQADLLAKGQYEAFEKLTAELDGGVRK